MKILDPNEEFKLPIGPKTLVETLLDTMSDAHTQWVHTRDEKWVTEYHQAYAQLREIGWDGGIDVDMELPDELMPEEYMQKILLAQKIYEESLRQ